LNTNLKVNIHEVATGLYLTSKHWSALNMTQPETNVKFSFKLI